MQDFGKCKNLTARSCKNMKNHCSILQNNENSLQDHSLKDLEKCKKIVWWTGLLSSKYITVPSETGLGLTSAFTVTLGIW
jgi:hypothetical protein